MPLGDLTRDTMPCYKTSAMGYLTATRYGLTRIEPTDEQYAAGWRQVWQHPSGLLAMRHPSEGYWVVSDGWRIADESWSSSLRGAARRINRLTQSR